MCKHIWLVMKPIWKEENLLGQFRLWSGVGDQLLQLPITFTISFWIASNTVNVSNHDSYTQLICYTKIFFLLCGETVVKINFKVLLFLTQKRRTFLTFRTWYSILRSFLPVAYLENLCYHSQVLGFSVRWCVFLRFVCPTQTRLLGINIWPGPGCWGDIQISLSG